MSNFLNPKTGKVDYLKGDRSFKTFWNIMATKNKYIYFLIVFTIIQIIEIVKYKTVITSIISAFSDSIIAGVFCSFGTLIPIVAIIALIIGMYKFWQLLIGNR